MNIVWKPIFDNRMEDRAHVIAAFNRHNNEVIAQIPAGRLLVFEAKHGWEPLCEFLDVPVPDMDYPRVNTTDDFNQARAAGKPPGTE